MATQREYTFKFSEEVAGIIETMMLQGSTPVPLAASGRAIMELQRQKQEQDQAFLMAQMKAAKNGAAEKPQ